MPSVHAKGDEAEEEPISRGGTVRRSIRIALEDGDMAVRSGGHVSVLGSFSLGRVWMAVSDGEGVMRDYRYRPELMKMNGRSLALDHMCCLAGGRRMGAALGWVGFELDYRCPLL